VVRTLGEATCFWHPVLATEAIGAPADLALITEGAHLGGDERRERSAGDEAHDVCLSGGCETRGIVQFAALVRRGSW
jgi:hypothetical protein